MERRGFLSTLLFGGGAALAVQSLPKMLLYDPAYLGMAAAPGPLVGIEAITRAIQREIDRQLSGRTVVGMATSRIGDLVENFHDPRRRFQLTNQKNVAFAMREGFEDELHERYIRPAADAMATALNDAKLNVFAPLPLSHAEFPGYVAMSNKSVIRGYMFDNYDLELDSQVKTMRFDVLAGHA